jgi:hypothetical protein
MACASGRLDAIVQWLDVDNKLALATRDALGTRA